MAIRLIVDPPRSGVLNMGLDEALLQRAGDGEPVLRIYGWDEPTVSLGYFQPHRDRRRHADSLNCPWLRRSTGGGAIVHDRELTYSFVWPAAARDDPRPIYRRFHDSLRDSLRELGATGATCCAAQPQSPEPFLCFQRRAEGDLLLDGHKVGGSAQRRRRRASLQHGSILWKSSPAAPQLPGISDLHPGLATQEEFLRGWLERLSSGWESFTESVFTQPELDLGADISHQRFAADAWTRKR